MASNPITRATENCDLHHVSCLLQQHAGETHHRPAQHQRDLDSALLLASELGLFDIAKCLIQKGKANVHCSVPDNANDNRGSTPLHLACEHGHTEMALYLLRVGASAAVHLTDQKGRTPLHVACYQGNYVLVKSLVETAGERSVVHQADNKRSTPLHEACKKGHAKIASYLVVLGGERALQARDSNRDLPYEVALQNGYIDMAKQYIIQDPHDMGNALLSASELGLTDKVRALAQAGANLHTFETRKWKKQDRGNTPIQLAFKHGHYETAQLLALVTGGRAMKSLDQNAKLLMTCWQAHSQNAPWLKRRSIEAEAKRLIKSGAKVNHVFPGGQTALAVAIFASERQPFVANRELINCLLTHGANTETPCNENGTTVLMRMVARQIIDPDDLDLLSVLIQAGGANVNVVDKQGSTALHWACRHHLLETINLLLKHGANPNANSTVDKSTPLMEAICYCPPSRSVDEDCRRTNKVKQSILRSLLAAGADDHATNCDGDTALHLACGADCGHDDEGHLACIQTLLEHDQENKCIRTANLKGNTPIMVACLTATTAKQNYRLIEFLLDQPGMNIHGTKSKNALTVACEMANVGLVQLLLNRGLSPTDQAAWNGMVQACLGHSQNEEYNEPTSRRYLNVIWMLVQARAGELSRLDQSCW